MDITLICDLYLPNIGGVQLVVNNLAKEFVKKGHSVSIIADKSPRSLKSHELVEGIEVDRVRFKLPTLRPIPLCLFLSSGLSSLLKMMRILKSKNPDVVNAHFILYNTFYTLTTKLWLKYPLVSTVHGIDVQTFPHEPRIESKIHKRLVSRLLRNSDFVTGCSHSALNAAEILCPEIKDRGISIPNGINMEEFNLNEKFKHEKPYILSIGRLEHVKGFDILISAFKEISREHSDIDLIIAGDGSQKDRYIDIIKKLNIENRVRLYGHAKRKEVIKLLNGCEFYVLPSRFEASPLICLEAMACKKAVLATNVGGVSEIVKEGETGVLVEPNNAIELAEKMKFFIENSELRGRMGATARKIVESEYTWDKIADKYLEIYKSIIQNA